MNWFKRALLSLWGHKGRSILLILVFGILAMLIYCGLAVHSAAEQEISNAKAAVGAQVTLKGKMVELKTEKYTATYRSKLERGVVDNLKTNPMVKFCNYYTFAEITSDKISPVCDKEELESEKRVFEGLGNVNYPTLLLIGVTDSARTDQFTAGGYKLISGRSITSSDAGKPNVMIEQQLAQKNKLKVGDKVSLCQSVVADQHKLEATVVGIFNAPTKDIAFSVCDQWPSNYIFTSYTEVYQIEPSVNNTMLTATYQLDDPSHVASFVAWSKKQIDSSKCEFVTNESWYKRMTGAISGVSAFANLLTIIIIIAACAIMGLIAALSIRGRRREFGILLSIGEKRQRIISQTLIETLIPVCISFCLAIFVGGLLAPLVGDRLLSQQVQVASNQKSNTQVTNSMPTDAYSQWDDHHDSFARPVSEIAINVSAVDVGGLAGISLLIVLMSSAFPCAAVLHLSPSRVLNKEE